MDRKPLKHEALIMDKLYIDKGSSCGRVFHKLLAIFVAEQGFILTPFLQALLVEQGLTVC